MYAIILRLLITETCVAALMFDQDYEWFHENFLEESGENQGVRELSANGTSAVIWSPVYKRNLQPGCTLQIESHGTDRTTLLVVAETGDRVELASWAQRAVKTVLGEQQHSLDRWQNLSVSLAELNSAFRIVVKVDSRDGSVRIRSIRLNKCSSQDFQYLNVCTFEDGKMCAGWRSETPNEYNEFGWRVLAGNGSAGLPEGSFAAVDLSKSKTATEYSLLKSDFIPANQGGNITCKVTFDYLLKGFTKYNLPSIAVIWKFDPDSEGPLKQVIDHHSIPPNMTWRNTERSIILPSITRLQVSISVQATYHEVKGVFAVDNIKLLQNCYAQLDAEKSERKNFPAASFSFTSCGASGRVGPLNHQCKKSYAGSVPEVNVYISDTLPGVQRWTVPKTDTYSILIFGAHGGFGSSTQQAMRSMIVGDKYFNKAWTAIPAWPSRIQAEANFTKGQKLLIIVGQAGRFACDHSTAPACNSSLHGNHKGSGGGGGGASMILLDNGYDMYIPLVVAGGGAGMGTDDIKESFDFKAAIQNECNSRNCSTSSDRRPGFGGSLNATYGSSLAQDGASFFPLSSISLQGGSECKEIESEFDTWGGFGGGGGACSAGGGGGGYNGGLVSVRDEPGLPGLHGESYWNPELVKTVIFEPHDPFQLHSPHGWVELTEHPLPCPCNLGTCKWLDALYSGFECICPTNTQQSTDKKSCIELRGLEFKEPHTGSVNVELAVILSCTVSGISVLTLIVYIVWRRRVRLRRSSMFHGKVIADKLIPTTLNIFYDSIDGPSRIEQGRIRMDGRLGEGAFSDVYHGSLTLGDKPLFVAIKVPKETCEQSGEDFLQEAKIISSFEHPNIIRIFGICDNYQGKVAILMELLSGGNLKRFLEQYRPNEMEFSELLIGDLVRIAADVACACKYLEEKMFIHRDIAARNVLLTEMGPCRVAKIADFGRSRDVYSGDYFRRSRSMQPVKWLPPEALSDGAQTSKSDVWSFGILLWEIFTMGQAPYPGKLNGEVTDFVKAGYTMEVPKICPLELQNIVRKCWRLHPDDRPSFADIEARVKRLTLNEAVMRMAIAGSELETETQLRPSVTSSSSSFEEKLDSPGAHSCEPLLGLTHFDLAYENETNRKNIQMGRSVSVGLRNCICESP